MQIKLISKQEAQEMLKARTTIMVDVREPEEFELYRVDGQNIVNIPLKSIAERLNYLAGFSRIICICRTNRRSMEAANTLARYGIDEIYVVDEGVTGWLFEYEHNKL
ncbi:MAG: rhodanese-like domain-containing protein [Nitrososphaerota archaeon]|jgi:rhodanese-related sulfurtransferase|nr:rhodanese-like domain-containing protein [Nitrososphaerota archaeon]MDG6930220.1 rhodanese-like domain-containing protein [Nitrososphaerota archaeon]MDG6931439.1 rhodanese-like domain-containing protein [Nitrososphaerota archaeon]MDG6936561.1 rhodanese-like domain-containing protein [Nitrososphaerota archaeon]MDG6944214.1 rhodanese-like domain-containing protein [Nitrososphaerota archaeon]